jgi:hypothetical protein
MVSPLDWLATVSQPFIAGLLALVAWYLKRGWRELREIKQDNQFFHRAIKGDERLGYPGLMDRTNTTKQRLNTVIKNQKKMHDNLEEYGVVDEDEVQHPEEINGPNPSFEDIE